MCAILATFAIVHIQQAAMLFTPLCVRRFGVFCTKSALLGELQQHLHISCPVMENTTRHNAQYASDILRIPRFNSPNRPVFAQNDSDSLTERFQSSNYACIA